MTSRKNINIFDFNGVNVAKHSHVAGEVFAISDCLVISCNREYAHRSVCYLCNQFHHRPTIGATGGPQSPAIGGKTS